MPSSGTTGNNKILTAGLLIVAVGVILFLWFSYANKTGESAAELQEKAVQKSGEDVAKSENPFQSENPLSNVEADPLGKTKEVLNPFETP